MKTIFDVQLHDQEHLFLLNPGKLLLLIGFVPGKKYKYICNTLLSSFSFFLLSNWYEYMICDILLFNVATQYSCIFTFFTYFLIIIVLHGMSAFDFLLFFLTMVVQKAPWYILESLINIWKEYYLHCFVFHKCILFL